MAAIKDAIAHESESVAQLFQPGMRIVLVIGVVLAVLQQVTGINVFLYYGPEIFKKLGTSMDAALLQTVVVGAVNLVFTIIAIWTVDKLGRKPLMIIGAAGMGITLFAMGLSAFYQKTELWFLVFILGYMASFALSVGPVTWVILSEIFPTKIRGRAMAVAAIFLWVANYFVSQTFPMMNENAWLVEKFNRAFPFWVYGGLCVVLVVFVLLFVPETKGKTLEEIEKHWQEIAHQVRPARATIRRKIMAGRIISLISFGFLLFVYAGQPRHKRSRHRPEVITHFIESFTA